MNNPSTKQVLKAVNAFKDEYLLDFINIEELDTQDEDLNERVLEKSIVDKKKIINILFCLHFFYYICTIRVITLKHNNEELRNTNGCYLVTQFSSNPNNRLILRQLQIMRFFLINNHDNENMPNKQILPTDEWVVVDRLTEEDKEMDDYEKIMKKVESYYSLCASAK